MESCHKYRYEHKIWQNTTLHIVEEQKRIHVADQTWLEHKGWFGLVWFDSSFLVDTRINKIFSSLYLF